MTHFKVGDTVKVIADNLYATNVDDYDLETDLFGENAHIMYGMTGKILVLDVYASLDVCVEFTVDIGGHSGPHGSEGKYGHCWWVSQDALKLVASSPELDKKTAVQRKSKQLQDQFNERKHNANSVPVQNDIGKRKKALPFPKITVTFRETCPF